MESVISAERGWLDFTVIRPPQLVPAAPTHQCTFSSDGSCPPGTHKVHLQRPCSNRQPPCALLMAVTPSSSLAAAGDICRPGARHAGQRSGGHPPRPVYWDERDSGSQGGLQGDGEGARGAVGHPADAGHRPERCSCGCGCGRRLPVPSRPAPAAWSVKLRQAAGRWTFTGHMHCCALQKMCADVCRLMSCIQHLHSIQLSSVLYIRRTEAGHRSLQDKHFSYVGRFCG